MIKLIIICTSTVNIYLLYVIFFLYEKKTQDNTSLCFEIPVFITTKIIVIFYIVCILSLRIEKIYSRIKILTSCMYTSVSQKSKSKNELACNLFPSRKKSSLLYRKFDQIQPLIWSKYTKDFQNL